MKRSEINAAIADASLAFQTHHWHLPPKPKWDVTGFGLGDFRRYGLVLVNLADLGEYCEKLLFAKAGQVTPLHCHRRKQEDIICRVGTFAMRFAATDTNGKSNRLTGRVRTLVNGEEHIFSAGDIVYLKQGERITLFPDTYHEFWPVSQYAVMGEVSTANDDTNDNFFENPEVGRYEAIDEDEPPIARLLSDQA